MIEQYGVSMGRAFALDDPDVARLKDEIDTHERTFDKFLRRGRKILKKYRDVRSPREDAITRYNILWANIQTRLPALYARNPKPVVERRYRDRDPVGRTASEILERSIEYTLEHCNDMFYAVRLAVLDYELPGLGCIWVRYEPHFKATELPGAKDEGEPQEKQNEETLTEGTSVTSAEEDQVAEETISYEETKLDYVSWEDVGWSWARTWQEVRYFWKRAYMDRSELAERFTDLDEEEIKKIPLDWSPTTLNDNKVRITRKKAVVYEVWDKHRRERSWLVKNYPHLLDHRGDDLGLHEFFPCARPLMANALSDEFMPTPNFTFYQDQANEIDELSTRIVAISKALKVAGVRDTSAEGLDRLLAEGVENQLVPVEGWAVLKEKGGLKGVIELLPLEEIAKALGYLREQRTALIEDVYQLTGIADIVRGFSDPDETATAQQMKGQFSMIRIEDSQREVQRFCRDIVRIVGQIVAGYSIETLKQISGVKLLTNEEKMQLQAQIAAQARMAAMAQQATPQAPPGAPQGAQLTHLNQPQMGAQPGPSGAQQQQQMHPMAPPTPATPAAGQSPISPDKQRLLELPTWEEIAALLENPVYREFRLDIETDSTIAVDEEAEKKTRMEFLNAVGSFLDKAVMAGGTTPAIVPMLGEILMFAVRAFKTARPVEQAFEDAIQALERAAQNPPPNPEMMKAQLEAQTQLTIAQQKAQLDMQVASAKERSQAQRDQIEQQLEAARAQHDAQLQAQLEAHKAQLQAASEQQIQQMKNEFEAQRVAFETNAKLQIAQLESRTRLQEKGMDVQHAANEADKARSEHAQQRGSEEHREKVVQLHASSRAEHLNKASENMRAAVEALSRPRKVRRGTDGRIEAIE